MAEYVFDFSKITVGELDKAMNGARFGPEVRQAIATVTGKTFDEISALPTTEYKRLVASFVKAAYDPVTADPN
jgi:hypothetical protein